MHARGCLAEDPFVDSGDTVGRAAPQHTGSLSYGVDGRDDGEAIAGPFEGGARLACSIDMRCGDVGLPGRPGIDIGVQLPGPCQPASRRPTAAFSIAVSSTSTAFAAGPSGMKLSLLVTRAIRPA